MRPTRWRRSTHVLIGVAVLLVVAGVVGVAAFVSAPAPASQPPPIKPEPKPAVAQPGVTPLADSAPKPTPDRLAATLAPFVADPNLGAFTGRVTDAASGTQLWAQGPGTPMQPASTNKVLTTAAALLTLDRDTRLTTTVLTDPDAPGLIILRGGGDPTLSAAPPDQPTWYKGAARISDLVKQVHDAGVAVKSVQVDTSAYSGPTMAPGWDPIDMQNGDFAPMESVMLDGGRTQPVSVDSTRSPTPALDAGRALAVALGVNPATVTVTTTASAAAKQIAAVQSPPLIERLRQLMNESDNVMAESTGREVAGALNRPQSFDGAVQAVLGQLRSAGIDTTGATLFDSSGLSVNDRLTALTLDGVVNAAAGDATPKLRPLLDVLPIAGGSGTLSNRYVDTDAGRAALGFLRAKTGSLTGTNALAGIVTDASGRVLTFALLSNNAGPTGRTAIDALAATLRSCGCGS
jgi:serine-type D-Ala-D-Ala carboxypeptidase/endopeptidase (penicillin-binding protein 4)